MKKPILYLIAGTLMTATACSSTDSAATADSTSMETSETVTAAGSTDEDMSTTNTNDATTNTTNTGTTGTESTSGSTNTTGTMGTTGTAGATGTDTGMSTEMDVTTLMNLDDATFMMTAASSNMLEIELGKMAAQKATDPQVKEFAKMMVEHHTKASQEMKSLASQLGVTLPTTLMPMHQEMVDKLSQKTGDNFDESYMDTMETAHKMDIAMFEAKTNTAESANVKSFASKTLPLLKKHQEKATTIEDTVD